MLFVTIFGTLSFPVIRSRRRSHYFLTENTLTSKYIRRVDRRTALLTFAAARKLESLE